MYDCFIFIKHHDHNLNMICKLLKHHQQGRFNVLPQFSITHICPYNKVTLFCAISPRVGNDMHGFSSVVNSDFRIKKRKKMSLKGALLHTHL